MVYRWYEGDGVVTDPGALRDAARRDGLGALFTRRVVPQVERRGARGLVYPAAVPKGMTSGDARWVAWRAPGDPAPVWGLYLAAGRLESPEVTDDVFVLIAWGDGPVLAWADRRGAARAVLRAALRVPPPWLQEGMRSRDVTFPVRIDRVGGSPRGSGVVPCVAVLRPQVARDPAVNTASPDVLLEIVRAWKQAHTNSVANCS